MSGYVTVSRTLMGAEVITGRDLTEVLSSCLSRRFQEGAICVVYDRNVGEIADGIIGELKGSGYRVFIQAVTSKRRGGEEEASPPEYVRHVFAVGAGTAAQAAKSIARRLDADWSLFLTAPSTDTIMCEYAPKMVFIDENVLIKCPSECIASGYGILLSQPLQAFESLFSCKVLATGGQLQVAPRPKDLSELAYALLEASVCKTCDGAQLMAELLYAKRLREGKRPRLIGEYKFLCAALLATFYFSYLSSPCMDVLPPSCRDIAQNMLEYIGYRRNNAKSVDFFDIKVYFRISYILGEYRTDLLDKLGTMDFRTAQRFWRRLYSDAGFWLKSETNCSELLSMLALAGSQSENLLGFAYASGVTAGFLR